MEMQDVNLGKKASLARESDLGAIQRGVSSSGESRAPECTGVGQIERERGAQPGAHKCRGEEGGKQVKV